MRKFLGMLFLAIVLMLNSGFGAIENSTYVQTEIRINATANIQKISASDIENESIVELPEVLETQSLTEKISGFMVITFTFLMKSMFDFIMGLVN